ncbi:unnamed protein product [Microthlaspi erraticum]|uniref:NAC domain-containing protein n=1 Tax=Microthlaspi erraticum TaxID=1685480 RepID=A0A6D2KRF3_9BRAS|nr:unnamed protein product [Microthlaspi erraticum]
MADPIPSDLKFSPTDERLVDYYLRNRVDTGRENFIKDIKLYEDEPWLLKHVKNVQFKEKKWFYFVVRKRGSGNRPKRTVPGRGGSNGGAWTTNGVKKEIRDRNKKLIGYKTELAYHKKVKGKTKGDTTGWCMTEYWLASKNDSEFQEVVLCHLRDKNNKKVNGTVDVDQLPLQPPVENMDDKNMTPADDDEEEEDDNNEEFLDGLETILEEEHDENNRAYGNGFKNMLEEEEKDVDGLQNMQVDEEEDDDKATQYPQTHLPLQGSESIDNPLVITEDDFDLDAIFDLLTQPEWVNVTNDIDIW